MSDFPETPVVPAAAPHTIPRISPEAIADLAQRIYRKEVFTSNHLVRAEDIPLVFLPVALGAFNDWSKEEIQQIGFLYADMKDASPRTINGSPMFFSMGVVHMEDAKAVLDKYNAIKAAVEAA